VIVIGVDSHKRTHTVVALDPVGRRLASKTVPATDDEHLALVEWAGQWPQVSFALEDCRHLTRRLERAGPTLGRSAGGAGTDPADGRGPPRRA
jgi:hypothetical protein